MKFSKLRTGFNCNEICGKRCVFFCGRIVCCYLIEELVKTLQEEYRIFVPNLNNTKPKSIYTHTKKLQLTDRSTGGVSNLSFNKSCISFIRSIRGISTGLPLLGVSRTSGVRGWEPGLKGLYDLIKQQSQLGRQKQIITYNYYLCKFAFLIAKEASFLYVATGTVKPGRIFLFPVGEFGADLGFASLLIPLGRWWGSGPPCPSFSFDRRPL